MTSTAAAILWVYIVLLLAGGLVGFLKAGSKASLIASTVSAVPLILVALAILPPLVAHIGLGVLAVVFIKRYTKTGKFMPAGMLVALSAVTDVALLYLHFASRTA